MTNLKSMLAVAVVLGLLGCERGLSDRTFDCGDFLYRFRNDADTSTESAMGSEYGQGLLSKYTTFPLTTDLSVLSERECRMIPHLIEASRAMDDVFWMQSYGNKDSLLQSIDDSALKEFARINYGPWDRLNNDAPFIDGIGDKPLGANFYPKDMSKREFEVAVRREPALASHYTVVVRDADEGLKAVPYHQAFRFQMEYAADELRSAAELADDPGLKEYLTLRADALVTGEYQASDMSWMNMKDNTLDIVIGPIEVYEDRLFGYKAATEAYVLIKDRDWSERLSRYSSLLPMLQEGLPVPPEYKREKPGTDSDLNAYDAIYYAGQANAGSKTIAINLPNDEEVQLQKGTRRLQLKNSMRAKFDKILEPMSDILIAEDQRDHVTFDAFFEDVMFHEVAHGLGIKRTLDGSQTVRAALKEHFSTIEEGKADILGLYMVLALQEQGELEADIRDSMVTFLAGIFRSVRFGASNAHGLANMIRFNFFREMGAFTRDDATGTYAANFDRMKEAMTALSEKLLRLQGDGDYDGVDAFIREYGAVPSELQRDLDRVAHAGIPVDIEFEQGYSALKSAN